MGVRELLLLVSVAGICLGSLANPRIALYGYIWYGLMRPDILAFAEDKYPLSSVFTAFLALGALRYIHRLPVLFKSPIARTLLLLQIPLFVSYILAIDPELSAVRYSFYVRMIVVLLLIPVMIETVEQLRMLLLVIVFSLGAIGVKYGAYGVVHGGTVMTEGYGHMLDDNNFLALAVAMVVPLAWHQIEPASSRWLKFALISITGFCVAEVIMSHSRGASLAMAAGVLVILKQTRARFLPILAFGACAGAAIYLVQDTYFNRMNTLLDPNQEASAASRIVLGRAAVKMWKDHPITGVGFGGMNFATRASLYEPTLDGSHVAHNSYLQVLVDSGTFAILLYLWLIIGMIRRMGRSGAVWRDLHPMAATIPYSLQASMIIFAIGAAFYSCQRMDLPYMVVLCAATWDTVESALYAEQTETTGDEEQQVVGGMSPTRV